MSYTNKLDIDLTGHNISDELQTDLGNDYFQLDHDTILANGQYTNGENLDIWTGAGQTGTQLIQGTDYELAAEDADLSSRVTGSVYTQVRIINATYQTGDLYFTYDTAGDYSEAKDINDQYYHNIDGFNDFVKDAKLHGGVEYIKKEKTLINSDFSISETFTGTGVMLITQVDSTSKTIDVTVDGSTSTITIPNADIDQNNVLIELQTGLAYDEHSITIDNASDVVEVIGFAIIKSNDRTSQNDSGVSYIDSERAEITADNQSFATPTSGRCDLAVVDDTGSISVVEGTDGASEKAFRVEEDGAISREYVDDIPELLQNSTNVWNSGVTGDSTTGWARRNYSSESNQYVLVSEVVNEVIYIGFLGTGIDGLFTKGSQVGIVGVTVDGGTEQTYDLYSDNVVYQHRVNIASNLDFGYHEVEIRVTGDTNNSNNAEVWLDAFDIYTPASPDLPTDSQELDKAYPMPSPTTMSSIPARPTSAEEKGWQRIESSQGCRYVGSGWNEYSNTNKSNDASYDSNTTDDYVEFSFLGDGVRLVCELGSDRGIAEISIDGTVETTVDLYSSSVINQVVAYENTSLSNGFHTIKVRVTGNKNSSSSGYYIPIDAFEIHQPLRMTDTRTLSPSNAKGTNFDDVNVSFTAEETQSALEALNSANNITFDDTNFFESQSTVQSAIQALSTAGVVDEGSTADGDYIRYENGWQVCARQFNIDYSTSDDETYNFPASFSKVLFSGIGFREGLNVDFRNNQNGTIVQYKANQWIVCKVNYSSSVYNNPHYLIAIGRWE